MLFKERSMKTNERKQENNVFKFEDVQYEILKRISLYISGVDRHKFKSLGIR